MDRAVRPPPMTLDYGEETLRLASDLRDDGVDRLVLVVRHAARHYDPAHLHNEPFMGLTTDGKTHAHEFGRRFPHGGLTRFFSSPIGRCVETAYQMEKGSLSEGARTTVNALHMHLMSFFLHRPFRAFQAHAKMGTAPFFRAWFSGELPADVMMECRAAHDEFRGKLVELLDQIDEPHVDVCASHDWNLYLLREMGLEQRQEDHGGAGYLEGVAVYRRGDQVMMKNHRGPERPV